MSNPNVNPFTDPFEDPSVKNAANSIKEEFNPFAPQNTTNNLSQSQQKSSTTSVPLNSDELFRRQEELRKREEELQRQEQEYERRKQNGVGKDANIKNWPPLPSFIPIEPCFYMDVDVEIPVQFQDIVRFVYKVYLIYVLALLINIFAAFLFLIFEKGGIIFFLMSIIQFIFFTPCAFLFWFRTVYKAFRDDSSFNFMIFFVILSFHTFLCMCQMLGFTDYSCGWIKVINAFNNSSFFVSIVVLFVSVAFTGAFIGMVLSLIRVHRFYRGSGFTIDKARKEFTDRVISDKNVQQAANKAAYSAASHAVNEAINGRY